MDMEIVDLGEVDLGEVSLFVDEDVAAFFQLATPEVGSLAELRGVAPAEVGVPGAHSHVLEHGPAVAQAG